MGIFSILRALEDRAGLDRRHGHPLWAYKLTEPEYEELRGELRRAFARGDDAPTPTAAAFCMVAAHHFCRTHEGGTWSWSSILDETRCPHSVGPRLYELVEKGLRYWGIGTVLSTEHRRYYHRTLACQGGLPLKLLTRGDSNDLQQFFRRLLQASELYAQPPRELAPALAAVLPQTLRNEIVYELASELVEAIGDLRARLADRSEDPLGDLDRLEPGWRSKVPLQLGDEVAESLLKGLLTEPSPREDGLDRAIVELELVLRLDGSPRLVRRARLAPAASEVDLKRVLRVHDELPPYFHLALLLPDGTRRTFGSAHRVQDTEPAVYRLVPELPERPIRRGPGVLGAVRVVASVGDADIGIGDVPGGQPIPEELPWVLRGSQLADEIPVRALGSARAAGNSMLLLLPAGEHLEPVENTTIEPLDDSSPEGRQLVRLQGSAAFTNADGDTCRFATRTAEDEVTFRLAGNVGRFAFSGSEFWRGTPSVLRIVDERERAVPVDRVQWKPRANRASQWRPWTRHPLGDVAIRVVEDGETVFRTFATILPAELTIELERLVPGRGAMVVHHHELQGVHLAGEHVHAEVTRAGAGRFEVSVSAQTSIAPALGLRLLFRQDCEATLQVPCPIELRRFVGFDGNPLPPGEVRAVDRLGGVRAVAVQATAQDMVVEARLESRPWRVIGELARQSDDGRLLELSLDRVQSAVATLLAASPDLDATVELRIVPKGGTLAGRHPTLCVQRYDTRLDPVREDGRVVAVRLDERSTSILGDQARGLLRVDVRPLDALGDEPVVLDELEPGVWKLPWDELSSGPWLALGWQGEWARLRPLLMTKPGDDSAELDRLQRAIRVYPEDARRVAIAEVLSSLEADFGAAEWKGVHTMAGTLGQLPAMTFDVVRMIACRPLSAAMLAVRSNAKAAVWAGLEELPFLWAALPVRAWVQAIRRAHEFATTSEELLRLCGSPNAASEKLLAPFFEAAPRRARFVAPVLELMTRVLPGLPSVGPNPLLTMTLQAGPGLLDRLLAQERERMVRRNSTRRWPTPNPKLSELVEPSVWSFMREHAPIDTSRHFQEAVFNAPAVTAAAAVLDAPLDEDALFEIRLLRDFDPEWFGFAHALSLTRLLAHQLTETPGMYDDVR